MSVELNPCRCGGKALLVTVYGTTQRYARCCQCCASGPWSTDPEKAAALWAEFCPMVREPQVEPWCHGCGLKRSDEPSVQARADGIVRCNDCQRAVEPRPGFRQCVFHKGHPGECAYSALPASYPEKRCSATERQHSPGPIGHVTVSPLVAAVETARASARCAELDLREALNAAGRYSIVSLLMSDLLEPLVRAGDRLQTIAQRIGEEGSG